ncbi:MAG: hypothetical protein KIS92_04545 [Planctomycetota bacterium]|nr:hypothetical protein [Planctomycetota bacterium]
MPGCSIAMRKVLGMLLGAVLLASGMGLSAADAPPPFVKDRWVFWQNNLKVDETVDKLEALMERAAKLGYTGFLIDDSKFGLLNLMDDAYFKNVERVKRKAAALKLDLIPAIFPMGYSNDILSQDPNLIEGLPVREQTFEVKNGAAQLVTEPIELKKIGYHDENVAINGNQWDGDAKGANTRVNFPIKLKPFRQYHVSVKIKTEDFKGQVEIKVLAKNLDLQHNNLDTKPTQDWTEHHVVFNSLEYTDLYLYFGSWGGRGKVSWKDAKIEEVGLVNLIRRPGTPVKIVKDDGAELAEGKDYEPVVDTAMGIKPWPGCYDQYHTPPTIKTSLPDGTKLKVSYHHAKTVTISQAMICPSEPKSYEVIKAQAQRMHKLFGAKRYMMGFDEIRVFNQCDLCRARNLDAGPMLADLARKCVAIMKEVAPDATLYTWNDMFDPSHNAHGEFYIVRGNLAGSWEGLSKDVNIVAWNFGQRENTFKFFGDRGHRMLAAGYYDNGDMTHTRQWLESARKSGMVDGIMYTTWCSNFADLEKFMDAIKSVAP